MTPRRLFKLLIAEDLFARKVQQCSLDVALSFQQIFDHMSINSDLALKQLITIKRLYKFDNKFN